MSKDTLISVEGVSKKYCRSLKHTLLYGIYDVLGDMFGLTRESANLRREEFWALNNISFEVKRGECLGLIGTNGAGKSTLLKLLNGIILPDMGAVRIRGRVGGLLELGAGFHPMLTGRENIYLSGEILGLRKHELEKKFDAIVEFAGLEDFINTPVKYYSSGMYVRLGFSVVAHTDPDILLVDEALAVGDTMFQTRCFAKFREFRERGATIMLVSHAPDLVTTHCDRVLLLDRGRVVRDELPKAVVDAYNRYIANSRQGSHCLTTPTECATRSKEMEWQGLFKTNSREDRYGSRRAEILEAGIFDIDDSPVQVLQRNREYVIKVKVRHNDFMEAAIVSFTIRDAEGRVLCGTNTLYQNVHIGQVQKEEILVIGFRQIARLNPGNYLLSLGCAAWENGEYLVYDRRFDYMSFQIGGASPRVGLFDPDCTIEWNRMN